MVSGGGIHSNDFCDVISVDNLFFSWKTFRKGKRSKADVAEFELNLEDNIFRLHDSLTSGKWKPDPYTAFYVQDPKLRRIHKASVRDRVLYQAIYQKLYPLFDKELIEFNKLAYQDPTEIDIDIDKLEQEEPRPIYQKESKFKDL